MQQASTTTLSSSPDPSSAIDGCPSGSSSSSPASPTSATTPSAPVKPAQKVIDSTNGTPGPASTSTGAINGSHDSSSLPAPDSALPAGQDKPLEHAGKKARKPRVVLSGTRDEILARNTKAAPSAVVEKLVKNAGNNWNRFYKNHSGTQFFKDRHWTEEAWDIGGILAPGQQEEGVEKGSGKAVLEVGCGTGAFIYPLLEHYPGARFVAFDFAKKAVELTKEHPLYNPSQVYAFQHDLTVPTSDVHELLSSSPPEFGEALHSFDIVSAIFVLSALAPRHQEQAVETLVSLIKPGGSLLFRDYALYDAAQLRFHSLPSASYASIPSLLSPRTASPADGTSSTPSPSPSPADASSSSSDPSSSSANPSSLAEPPSTASSSVDESKGNLAWYKRGDNTFTFFFTAADISTLISRAVSTLNERSGAKKGEEAFIELDGGVEVVERQMFNRAEDWGCTRRFVHGSWRRLEQV